MKNQPRGERGAARVRAVRRGRDLASAPATAARQNLKFHRATFWGTFLVQRPQGCKPQGGCVPVSVHAGTWTGGRWLSHATELIPVLSVNTLVSRAHVGTARDLAPDRGGQEGCWGPCSFLGSPHPAAAGRRRSALSGSQVIPRPALGCSSATLAVALPGLV